MRIKIIHPLWIHLPAVAALAVLIVYVITGLPLPGKAAVLFSFDGSANGYGSPWVAFGLAIGMSAFYITLSFLLDELWARQETAKNFNWMSVFDEVVVGGLVGTSMAYLSFIKQDGHRFLLPWAELIVSVGALTTLAVILEMVRPFKPHWQQVTAEDVSALRSELAKRLPGSAPLVYWEVQNPWYVRLMATALPAAMFAGALILWFSEPSGAIVMLVVGGILVLLHGGQRTIVTRREVKIRYGILGFKPLQLRTSDIAGVEIHSFAPLRDFGGYGIRFNREMRAFYLNGTRGVKLTTTAGKKYLLGSNHPERLATVISAVAGIRKEK